MVLGGFGWFRVLVTTPISHSGTRFSSEEAQLSVRRGEVVKAFLMRGLNKFKLYCYALSNQVSKFVVNIDLEAEMEPCNRSSGRSETTYESCDKQMLQNIKEKKDSPHIIVFQH